VKPFTASAFSPLNPASIRRRDAGEKAMS